MYICKLDSDLDDEDKNPLWKKTATEFAFNRNVVAKW